MKTTVYKFTPASGQCAAPVTMTISVQACTSARIAASQTEAKVITPEKEGETKVWPNPTQSSFNLVVNGNGTETANIVIFDIQGRQLEQRRVATGQVIHFGDSYKAGVYIVEIRQGPAREIIKIIKQ